MRNNAADKGQYITSNLLNENSSVVVESQSAQDSDGVTVHLKKTDKDGNESTETVRASYVVGADGARGESEKIYGP